MHSGLTVKAGRITSSEFEDAIVNAIRITITITGVDFCESGCAIHVKYKYIRLPAIYTLNGRSRYYTKNLYTKKSHEKSTWKLTTSLFNSEKRFGSSLPISKQSQNNLTVIQHYHHTTNLKRIFTTNLKTFSVHEKSHNNPISFSHSFYIQTLLMKSIWGSFTWLSLYQFPNTINFHINLQHEIYISPQYPCIYTIFKYPYLYNWFVVWIYWNFFFVHKIRSEKW